MRTAEQYHQGRIFTGGVECFLQNFTFTAKKYANLLTRTYGDCRTILLQIAHYKWSCIHSPEPQIQGKKYANLSTHRHGNCRVILSRISHGTWGCIRSLEPHICGEKSCKFVNTHTCGSLKEGD